MATRILAIETNGSLRDLICRCLGRESYEVVGVSHGVEAIQEMRRTLPDLLVIDQSVPAGGLRTARILRLNPEFRSIPVLITLSGVRDRALSVIKEGQTAGIRNFLVKPYTPSMLVNRVTKELSERRGPIQLNIAQIQEEVRSLADLPVMSQTHGQIIEILNEEDAEVDMTRLLGLIESDPSLVATILKIARSAFYGFHGGLLKGAVTYLGLKRLREIVYAATVLNIFKEREGPETDGDFSIMDLWRHSVACGVVMKMLSREVKGRAHFLLGLLHDIGKVILNHRFSEYFKEVLRIASEEKRSVYDVEKDVLGITHADVGHVLGVSWQLPPEVTMCIAYHHWPSDAQMHKRLGSLAHIADIAVRTMGVGYAGDPLIPEMDPYADRLRITVDSIVARKEEIVKQVESIVSVRTPEDEP